MVGTVDGVEIQSRQAGHAASGTARLIVERPLSYILATDVQVGDVVVNVKILNYIDPLAALIAKVVIAAANAQPAAAVPFKINLLAPLIASGRRKTVQDVKVGSVVSTNPDRKAQFITATGAVAQLQHYILWAAAGTAATPDG